MALLDGNDERLRYTAFIALRGNIDMPRVRDRLIACLSDPNEQVAYEAAVFLGRTRNPEGIAVAAELLEHEDPQKRRIGTLTLGYARDPRAIKPLVEVLDATDPHNTRWIAVNLLAKFDDPVAVEALRRVAESDPDANRRSRAKRLLKDKAASTQPSR